MTCTTHHHACDCREAAHAAALAAAIARAERAEAELARLTADAQRRAAVSAAGVERRLAGTAQDRAAPVATPTSDKRSVAVSMRDSKQTCEDCGTTSDVFDEMFVTVNGDVIGHVEMLDESTMWSAWEHPQDGSQTVIIFTSHRGQPCGCDGGVHVDAEER